MTAKKAATIKHTLKLEGFDLEKGKITLHLLSDLNEYLTRLAESTLLSFVEGNSTIKRGKQAEWLSRSLDFQLSGLKSGSTILEIEAPVLSSTLSNIQVSIFSEREIEAVSETSAVGLSMRAYDQAVKGKLDSPLLDKHLLQVMQQSGKFLSKKGSSISISSDGKNPKQIKLRKESIEKIKTIEAKTPASVKTKVTGVLDVMKHSNNRLELLSGEGGRIRAILKENLSISKLTPFFGKLLTVAGTAHFNPLGDVISFEITSFSEKSEKEKYFSHPPAPLFEETDLRRVIEDQNYRGFKKEKIESIVDDLHIDESLEDLLASLK